jgi:hypothetical protein
MNNDIKQKIVEAISQAKKKGYTLISNSWGREVEKCACPMGCVLVANGMTPNTAYNLVDSANILGVPTVWITSFIEGFDNIGTAPAAYCQEAWELGHELRTEMNPIPHNRFIYQG